MRKLLKYTQYVVFLCIGIFIFYYLYKDLGVEKLKTEIKNLDYFWIIVSFVLSMLSHISRAVRWNMLIKPLGYKPKVYNSFFAVMIMYLVNLILPRAGEVARCTVLAKYEKASFSSLVGTVAIERLTDLIILITLAFFIILSQLSAFNIFLDTNLPAIKDKFQNLTFGNYVIILAIILTVLFGLFMLFKHSKFKNKFDNIINKLKTQFVEGFSSIKKVEKKGWYVFHTLLIYVLWLFMLFVVFYAYKPTEHLTIPIAMFTFVMSGLAMIAPVQGGIGPWHFMVMQSLIIFGIPNDPARIFAFIAHTATNLGLVIMGVISFVLLPLLNNNKS